ncbi:MAG: bifunctional 5,10-methylenetetrahydrofolate dehydrogenase/5,10-methenyltetrahydrofolate cyclohydrolase [Coriobacteriia bacterium]|nr:bifunctional 5,10-methylenetetrahydrofolate dehydrogenase/5,10-methenyltetrahydrofolate cyclohydrolase [Coriobacteriia bacterium]
MAELLLGLPVAKAINERLLPRVEALRAAGAAPRLAIVRVGAREDDLSYERGALKRCSSLGIEAEVHEVDAASATTETLVEAIEGLNARADVHGVLMFRPLPRGIDEAAVCDALDPAKDVDCLTRGSLYGVLANKPCGFAPCTAEAVIELLDHYGVELDGANVCVVGRSLVIGKPVSLMLQARNATVTMCHTHTRDLAAACRAADVVVAAAGHARTIGADAVRSGQVIVDVGINWDAAAGKLVGDVDFESVEPEVAAVTPVPRGVGSVTTAVLAKHVVEAAERTLA